MRHACRYGMLLLGVVLLNACGAHESGSQLEINGGTEVTPTEAEFHSTLRYIWIKAEEPAGGVFSCSATLITNQIALTAAHCFAAVSGDEMIASAVDVGARTMDLLPEGAKYKPLAGIEVLMTHPDYTHERGIKIEEREALYSELVGLDKHIELQLKTLLTMKKSAKAQPETVKKLEDNVNALIDVYSEKVQALHRIAKEVNELMKKPGYDLALIKLHKPLEHSLLRPVSLGSDNLLSKGDRVIVAGFGITGEGLNDLINNPDAADEVGKPAKRPVLNKVELQVDEKNETSGDFTLSPVEHQPGAVCPGDSGGPAYRLNGSDLELVGVISIGDCERSSVINGIDLYRDWIDKTVKELEAL